MSHEAEIWALSPRRSPHWLPRLQFLLTIISVGTVVGLVIMFSYQQAKVSHPQLTSSHIDIAAIRRELNSREVALGNLSSDARAILAKLDATTRETAHARETLVAAIATLERNRTVAVQTRSAISNLAGEQLELNQRIMRIRQLLAGEQPISKKDLDAAQRSGWWQGVIVGVLTSVVGSFIFRWLTTRQDERPTEERAG